MNVFIEEGTDQRTIEIWLDREGKYVLGQEKGLRKNINLEKHKEGLGESELNNLARAEFMEVSR